MTAHATRVKRTEAGREPHPPALEGTHAPRPGPGPASLIAEAQRAGLLEGERTAHLSFRAPPALVEAAMRETGISSPTELGLLALASLARPDPVAAFLRRTRGSLGQDHELET